MSKKDDASLTLRISPETKEKIIRISKAKKMKAQTYVRSILMDRLAADDLMDDNGLTISSALKLAMEGKLSDYVKKKEKKDGKAEDDDGQDVEEESEEDENEE